MRIVREVAFIQYAEQSVCIISRNCCRSIGKWVKRPLTRHLVLRALEAGECLSAANQEMYIYAQTWSGYLLQFLRDSRLLNRFVVHRLQRLKSSHLDIISKCILFLFYVLVLISSIYLFLSMFVLVFCQFIGFPLLLLFMRIPLLLIPGPSNLSWPNPRISNHCNTLPSNDIEVKRYFERGNAYLRSNNLMTIGTMIYKTFCTMFHVKHSSFRILLFSTPPQLKQRFSSYLMPALVSRS